MSEAILANENQSHKVFLSEEENIIYELSKKVKAYESQKKNTESTVNLSFAGQVGAVALQIDNNGYIREYNSSVTWAFPFLQTLSDDQLNIIPETISAINLSFSISPIQRIYSYFIVADANRVYNAPAATFFSSVTSFSSSAYLVLRSGNDNNSKNLIQISLGNLIFEADGNQGAGFVTLTNTSRYINLLDYVETRPQLNQGIDWTKDPEKITKQDLQDIITGKISQIKCMIGLITGSLGGQNNQLVTNAWQNYGGSTPGGIVTGQPLLQFALTANLSIKGLQKDLGVQKKLF
jgi:hypothetical protein